MFPRLRSIRNCARQDCGQAFTLDNGHQRYCTRACATLALKETQKARRAEFQRPSSIEAARLKRELSLYDRPITRRDCGPGGINEPDEFSVVGVNEDGTPSYEVTRRHCPWVSCVHHLALSVMAQGGLKIYGDPAQMVQTCSLDFDSRPQTLEAIAGSLNITRERVRQLEQMGIKSARQAADKGLLPLVDDAG